MLDAQRRRLWALLQWGSSQFECCWSLHCLLACNAVVHDTNLHMLLLLLLLLFVVVLPLQGMALAQLRVLGQVLRDEFGPDGTLGTTLTDVTQKLAQRGVEVSREALVNELRVAGSAEYDRLPAEKRWGPRCYFDESDQTIGAL